MGFGRVVKVAPAAPVSDPPRVAAAAAAGGTGAPAKTQSDTYLERVAKYVPAEVVAFFLFANNILKQAVTSASSATPPVPATMAGISVDTIGWVLFAVALVLCPAYIYKMREPDSAWKTNAFLSLLLFPIWTYAIDAVMFSKVFDGRLASLVLGLATLLSGLVAPTASPQRPAEKPVPAPVAPPVTPAPPAPVTP